MVVKKTRPSLVKLAALMNKHLVLLTLCAITPLGFADDFKWSTRIMIDADQAGAFYQKDADDTTQPKTSAELASLKSSFKYAINESIDSKLQIDVSKTANDDYETQIEFKDVYLRRRASDFLATQIGQFKEPLGHDTLLGSGDRMTKEASMVSSAFTPGRNLGASVQLSNNHNTLNLAVFEIQDDDIDNGYAFTARATTNMTIFEHMHSPIHVGAGYSYRSIPNTLLQIKERGEVNTADNIIRSPRFYADSQHIANLELGASVNNLWFMSEFFSSQVNQTDGQEWHFSGFYLQLSASLFRSIGQFENGLFKPAKHGSNDIQWVVRYSGISLRDNDIGSEASSTLIGLNYYFKKQSSLMLNATFPSIAGNVVNTNQSGQALSIRFKHTF